MSTYTQILYQIIFSTKNREKTLLKENREKLFKYMGGIIKNKNCYLYRIGGVENHIHIVTGLHPSESLANLVKDIKVAASSLIKEKSLFPSFSGWQIGYAAFTYAIEAKNNLIRYVMKQEVHHNGESFMEEYTRILHEFEIEYDEKYLF